MARRDDINASMRNFWDEKARENAMYYISSYRAYDQQDPEEFWKWGRILTDQFLDESKLAFTGEEHVLEIGCGVGRMTRRLAERFRHVTGLDVSEEMIRRARENLAGLTNVTLDVGNGADLASYPDAAFDFVFSYIVFQHIPDPRITLDYIREAGRVLRTGGNFYFQVNTTPRIGPLRAGLGRLKRMVLGSHGGRPSAATSSGPRSLDHPAWVGSRVTLAQVGAGVAAGGMRIERLANEGTQYTWVLAQRTAP